MEIERAEPSRPELTPDFRFRRMRSARRRFADKEVGRKSQLALRLIDLLRRRASLIHLELCR